MYVFSYANIEEKKAMPEISNAKNHLFLAAFKNKKGEGRFSFTFLRREISPAFNGAAYTAILIESVTKLYNFGKNNQ
jgi:hypothetical protein